MAAEELDEVEGRAVDARGFPAVDPSNAVRALGEAANKRQDDLRAANTELFSVQLKNIERIVEIRAECAAELVAAESRRVNEQLTLRSYYSERLEVAESKRIDAIRAVDVNAVAVANQRSSDQAAALATQVAQSAEVLRNQVASQAEALRALVATTAAAATQTQQQQNQTLSTTQQQQHQALSTRLATIELALSEGRGKQSYSDPAFTELLSEVKTLRNMERQTVGVSQGISTSWAVFIGAAMLLIAIIGAGVAFTRTTTPQVTYAPSSNVGPR